MAPSKARQQAEIRNAQRRQEEARATSARRSDPLDECPLCLRSGDDLSESSIDGACFLRCLFCGHRWRAMRPGVRLVRQ